MNKIRKSFPGVLALDDVNFTLNRGEIHCLMGENGAGKSTLIKVLTGVYRRDGGEVLFEGRSLDLRSPHEAPRQGISTVYQEVNLIPGLSVAENIYLGRQPMKAGGIDWKTLREGARKALARLDISIDVDIPLGECSIALQQMTAIARALDIDARILVLDEPTSSLDSRECENLFAVLRRLREEGLGIVFITHFLDQVYAVSDRITVLRNGSFVGTWNAEDLPKIELVARMIGRTVDPADRSKLMAAPLTQRKVSLPDSAEGSAPETAGERAHQVHLEGLGRKGTLHPVDLDLASGEVLGLAGLLGSGRTELARLLFGLDRSDTGSVTVDGKTVRLDDPHDAIRSGFAFCPEDRKVEGIFDQLSLRDNIALALQAKRGIFRPLSRRNRESMADKYIDMLGIKTPSRMQIIKHLSGGNQQKAILARWMVSDPRFLILDEPTRGIDVNAKEEIQRLIRELKNAGLGVLFISSELSEVVRSSDRIAVLRDRKKVAELASGDIDESRVVSLMAEGANP